jgi:hypothetical protein
MMKEINVVEFTLLDPKSRALVARVALNGYHIEAGGPLGDSGGMTSFMLLDGSVYSYWQARRTLLMRWPDGEEALIRIAGLPVEEGEAGLIEFL